MDVEDYRIKEEEEEKEESIDYEYENKAIKFKEEEVKDLEEVTLPWVSSWIDYADGKIVHGIMVIDDDIHNPKDKCQLADCSICYQPWTCRENH
nr:zinc finger, RING/FYVE/PHD-type [Tanacetum cinerariifolium]